MTAPESTGNKHTEAYDQKLEEILHVAARIMAEKGYHRASIRSLAAETEMTLAGLYYYFKGKEELLFLIQHSTFDSLVSSLSEKLTGVDDAVAKLNILVRNHLDFFLEHMDELKICAYEIESLKGEYYEEVATKRREYFQLAHGIVNELIEKGTHRGVDSRLATLSLFGTLNWIFMWYTPGRYAGVDEMSWQLTRLYLHGLAGGLAAAVPGGMRAGLRESEAEAASGAAAPGSGDRTNGYKGKEGGMGEDD
jgi:AcrR family transcriptional regulator